MPTDWEVTEHDWEPACPGGSLCRYCGKESDDVIHPLVLGKDGPQLVQAEQCIPLVILDLADRGAMLQALLQVAERQLQRDLLNHGLRARGDIVLTVQLTVEAS